MNTIGILIKNHINFQKNKSIRCEFDHNNVNNLKVKFILPIPNWLDNESLLKNEDNDYIVYAKKRGNNNDTESNSRFKITNKNLGDIVNIPYGRNKYLIKEKTYKSIELGNQNNLLDFLKTERNNMFREIKSDILLMRLGDLGKQYEALTGGNDYYNSQLREANTPGRGITKVKVTQEIKIPF